MSDKFVSSDLMKIKDRLNEASRKVQQNKEAGSVSDRFADSAGNPQPASETTIFIHKCDELIAKFTEAIAAIEEDASICEFRNGKLNESKTSLKELLNKVKAYRETDLSAEKTSTGLSGNMRSLENAKLELIRVWTMLFPEQAQLSKPMSVADPTSGTRRSFLPEVRSLGFIQLFRIGFSFFLPLILALIFAAVLLSITIIISLGA